MKYMQLTRLNVITPPPPIIEEVYKMLVFNMSVLQSSLLAEGLPATCRWFLQGTGHFSPAIMLAVLV